MPLPFGSKVVYAGDSITASAESVNGTSSYWNAQGFAFWSQVTSGHRLFYASDSNAGVGGDTSTQLLARYAADVTDKDPSVVVILIGTNDVGGVTNNAASIAATCIANIEAMISANRAISAKTILIKVLPRGSVGSPMSANQITCWEIINDWIDTQAASDCLIADCESLVGNEDAAHTIKAGWTTSGDNLHPLVQAAQPIGEAVGALINQLAGTGDPLFTSNSDALNLCANGFMTGDNSGVATGWSVSSSLGGATLTSSKVTRNDAYGEWQQLQISGTYTGSSKSVQLSRTVDLTGLVNNGDTFELVGELDVSSLTGIHGVMIQATISGILVRAAAAVTGDVPAGSWSGPIRSLPTTVAADAGSVSFNVTIYFADTVSTDAIAATVKIGRLGIRKAPLSRAMRLTWT